jgi:hypothetical protein
VSRQLDLEPVEESLEAVRPKAIAVWSAVSDLGIVVGPIVRRPACGVRRGVTYLKRDGRRRRRSCRMARGTLS